MSGFAWRNYLVREHGYQKSRTTFVARDFLRIPKFYSRHGGQVRNFIPCPTASVRRAFVWCCKDTAAHSNGDLATFAFAPTLSRCGSRPFPNFFILNFTPFIWCCNGYLPHQSTPQTNATLAITPARCAVADALSRLLHIERL